MNIIRETAAHNTMIIKLDIAFWALNILAMIAVVDDNIWLSVFFIVVSWVVWAGQMYVEKKYEEQVSAD